MGGSWYQAAAILREARDVHQQERFAPPVACPYDGTLLQFHPTKGLLFCPNGDFRTTGKPRET